MNWKRLKWWTGISQVGVWLGLLVGPGRVDAGLIQVGTQHFRDGQIINIDQYSAAVVNQVAPFNSFIGSDVALNLATSYRFDVSTQPITAGSFTFGIFDGDSAAAGNQVGSFLINGIDLTSLLNAAFEGHGGTQMEYNVYSILLPGAVLASFGSSNGTALISLSLAGPGLGGDAGTSNTPSTYNGAGLDFSSLNLTPATVPEPSSLLLVGIAGTIGLASARRHRFQRISVHMPNCLHRS